MVNNDGNRQNDFNNKLCCWLMSILFLQLSSSFCGVKFDIFEIGWKSIIEEKINK